MAYLKTILLVAFFFSLHSCSATRYDVALVKQHESNFVNQKYETLGWDAVATGGGFFNGVEKIFIGFEVHQRATIEQARQLIVEATLEYLDKINSDEKLKTYLNPCPFTSANVEICLYFTKGRDETGYLYYVSLMSDSIAYKVMDSQGWGKEIYQESFQEAQQKLGLR